MFNVGRVDSDSGQNSPMFGTINGVSPAIHGHFGISMAFFLRSIAGVSRRQTRSTGREPGVRSRAPSKFDEPASAGDRDVNARREHGVERNTEPTIDRGPRFRPGCAPVAAAPAHAGLIALKEVSFAFFFTGLTPGAMSLAPAYAGLRTPAWFSFDCGSSVGMLGH